MAETIDISLKADTRQLINSLKELPDVSSREARDMVRGLQREYRNAEKAAKKSAGVTEKAWVGSFDVIEKGAAGILAAGAAFAALSEDIHDTVDEMNTLSQSSGLSTDVISGMRLAAANANKDLKDLVPTELGKRILEVAGGTGEARDAFRLLGIEARDSSGEIRSADEVYFEIIDKLQQVDDQGTRAGLAMKALGPAGQQVLSGFEDSKGLERFVENAKEFGINAAPDAVAASGEWFNATSNLSLAFENAQKQLTDNLGPAAALFINNFSLGVVQLTELVPALFDVMEERFQKVSDGYRKLVDGDIRGFFNAFNEARDDVNVWEDAWTRAMLRSQKFWELNIQKADESTEGTKKNSIAIKDLEGDLKAAEKAAAALAAAQREAVNDADQLMQIMDKANEDILSGVAAVNLEWQEQLNLIAELEDEFGLAADAESAVLDRRQRELAAFREKVAEDAAKSNEKLAEEDRKTLDDTIEMWESAAADMEANLAAAQRALADFMLNAIGDTIGNTSELFSIHMSNLRSQAEEQEQGAIDAAEAVADQDRNAADAALEAARDREGISDEELGRAEAAHEAELTRIQEQLDADIAAADKLKDDEREAVLKSFEVQQTLARTLAIIDSARNAVALIPAFSFLGPGAGFAAAGAAAAALATQLAVIEAQSPPEFPRGLTPDHRLVGLQDQEGIANRRAMGHPANRRALRDMNEGQVVDAPQAEQLEVRVGIDSRLHRLKVTTDRRVGKKPSRRR